MAKLPVFDTIGAAYRFAFVNFTRIFMVAGPPLLAAAIAGYFIQDAILGVQIDALVRSADGFRIAAPTVLAYGVVSGIIASTFSAVAAVGLHRMALFGPEAARLGFGRIEWRYVVMSVIFETLFLVPSVILVLTGITPGERPNGAVAVGALALFVAYLAFAIASIRLLPMFPHIVATGEIAPGHAVRLSRGNWWRTLGTLFFAFLPMGVIFAASDPVGLNPNAERMSTAELVPIYTQFRDSLPVTSAILYVCNVLMTAIGTAILAFSYKIFQGLPIDARLPEPQE